MSGGAKFKWSFRPYLTEGERNVFKKLRASGQISFFGVAICNADGCDNEVPKFQTDEITALGTGLQPGSQVKRFCSASCFSKTEGEDDDKEKEDHGQEEEDNDTEGSWSPAGEDFDWD